MKSLSKKITSNNIVIYGIIFTTVLFSSCGNMLGGKEFLSELEVAVKNANSNEAVVRIECIPEKKNLIIPPVGPLASGKKREGSVIELNFEESDAYVFDKWQATPEGSVKFDDEKNRNTRAVIVSSVSDITIEPLCIKRNVLTVNFLGKNGTTNPYEQKNYFSGQSFPLSYRSETAYCFTKWDVLDSNKLSLKNPPVKFIGNGTEVIVEVLELESDMEITIVAVSQSRPTVNMNYPKMSQNGVEVNTCIKVYFNREMDDTNISDYISIINSKTEEDLTSKFNSPELNKTDLQITPKDALQNGIEVLVTISGNFPDKDGIPLGADYTWTYKIKE